MPSSLLNPVMLDLGRHNILGVGVSAVDYDRAVAGIIEAARERRPYGVSALAVHGVMTGVQDKEHRHRLNALELVVPDGQPVRWALRWLHGVSLPDRVYGPELTLRTCAAAAEAGLPLFLFGGTEEVQAALVDSLKERYPTIKIAGRRVSKFRTLSSEERDELVAEIAASGAAITLVGIGCPRQEVWAYEFRQALSMPVLAVGAAFNFHAGLLPQAPKFLQDRGLEWAYRLFREPRRLWRRYLYLNPYYLTLVAGQKLGLYRPGTQDAPAPKTEILYG